MKRFDPNNFVDYTISGNGWNVTFSSALKALSEWKHIDKGTLYGNRYDGTRAVLDSRL